MTTKPRGRRHKVELPVPVASPSPPAARELGSGAAAPRDDSQDRPTPGQAPRPGVAKTTAAATRTPAGLRSQAPAKFTYALKPFTVEIRSDGWWAAPTPFLAAGEKLHWSGPFETIESVVLSIGRRLAAEIADRHTRSAIEGFALAPGDPLYGLKPTTGLSAPPETSTDGSAV